MVLTGVPVPLAAPTLGDEEVEAVTRVLRSGRLAQGPEVAAFEEALCATIGAPYAVAVNSGTAAVHAALAALGVGDGDEVVTTPFTFAATATPVLMLRANVRFADVDPATYLLDPASAQAKLTSRTRAVIAVDLFGQTYDRRIDALRGRGVAIVEDAAQAIGASRDGIPAGHLGDVATFSFYATKNLTTGEGGAVMATDPGLAQCVRAFRQHGMVGESEPLSLGYNYRMTEMCAALGRVQLSRLAWVTESRRRNAARLDEALGGVPGLITPHVAPGARHAYHHYSILVDERATANGADRDRVAAALSARGIGCGVYYRTPLHLQPVFRGAGYGPGDFPIAERIARQVLSLPVRPALTVSQLDAVITAVREALGARG